MTAIEELTNMERAHQVWLIKFNQEHDALRAGLVEKYGEAGVSAVEESVLMGND